MLKKLHWLFLKSFIGPFIGTFFIALFLLLMQTIWKYLEDLVGKGLELAVIFEFIFYFAIHLIPLALPLAILLSSIMVFGNLAERYELVAIKSAGVSLIRAMLPMFIISVIMAFAAFYTANKFIPKANLSWGALLYDVTQKKPAFNLEENVFFKSIAGYAIRVGKKHADNETLEDILIYVLDRRHAGNNNILVAKKGRMHIDEDQQFMTLYLEDGKRYQEMVDDPKYKETMPHNVMAFETYTLTIDMSELQLNRTEKERFSEDHRMLNVEQLKTRVDSLDRYIDNKKKSLYRYISPYFHEATDTLQITESDVDKRFEQLVSMAKSLKQLPINNDSTATDSVQSVSRAMPLVRREKTNKRRKQLVQERENILERAINNSNNLKRMSMNNINDTDLQHELKAKYEIEWHRKYTLAVSCILLFFIGAPLGAIIRKGGFGMPLVVSLLLFIVYYILNVFGEKLVREGQMDAWLGMWFSTFILFPLAIFLTYKASTDSRLLDSDSWNKIKRLFTKNANSSTI
jgi:lipopolysaccharide export system permease protein